MRPQLPSPVSTTPLLGSRVWLPRQSQEQGQESCSKTEAGPLGPWGVLPESLISWIPGRLPGGQWASP